MKHVLALRRIACGAAILLGLACQPSSTPDTMTAAESADDAPASVVQPRASTTPLHAAAAHGDLGEVERLLTDGADVNARDEDGMTPLHHAGKNGHRGTAQTLVEHNADVSVRDNAGRTAADYASAGAHGATLAAIESANPTTTSTANPDHDSGDHKRTSEALADGEPVPSGPLPDKPNLKYPTLESYQAALGAPGTTLMNDNVVLFAPRSQQEPAKTIFTYLSQAYDALYEIVGRPTKYRIVVYHFPEGHPDARGGTSECVIWYGCKNLDLASDEEWTAYGVPHVSGYIEEMAHNFVDATHAQFGWEMTGWSIGVLATRQVADNPIFEHSLARTREVQAETYARYVAGGYVFPADIEANLVDRIHAHLLHQCELQYGDRFWPDFFAQIRKEKDALDAAVALSDGDAIRNERYRITVNCFDRLPGLNFVRMLSAAQISLTTDIKSLHPTDAGWNRRLQ